MRGSSAQWLSQRLGQQFVVENRAGAGGNIASDYVIHAAPDGYTLLYASTAVAINATLDAGKVDYDFQRDTVPIAAVVRTPFVMEVNNDLPVKTVPEFIAYAKANPGKINFATVGPGSAQHLYGEYFKMLTGIAMVPVHYHGAAPALTDLIAGRVQVMFDVVVSSLSYIKSGQVRALAVTTAAPRTCCRACRRSANSCRAMKPAAGKASARPRARRPTSSTSSIARSMPASPTPISKPSSPSSAA